MAETDLLRAEMSIFVGSVSKVVGCRGLRSVRLQFADGDEPAVRTVLVLHGVLCCLSWLNYCLGRLLNYSWDCACCSARQVRSVTAELN